MFICGAISAVGRAGKALCGCICTLVVGGPIMIIVGIVLLAVKNTRADDIATFNKAAAAYNTSIARAFTPATFSTSISFGNYSLNYQERSVVVDGNSEGVDSVQSSTAYGSFTPDYTIDFDFNFYPKNTDPFTSRAKIDSSKYESIRCDYSRGCTTSDMVNICQREHPGGSYTGGSCSYRSSCGKCSYSAYLSEYCVVVDGSLPRFTRDNKLSSCFYPFSADEKSQKYANRDRGTIYVTVRHSSDPFIVLQRISKGTMDFGITEAQQKGVGTACLIIGILMVVASCGLGVCLFFLARAAAGAIAKRNEGQSELIPNGAYSPHHLPPPGTGGAYQPYPDNKPQPQPYSPHHQGYPAQQQQQYPQQYPQQPPPPPHYEQPYMGQPVYNANQMPPPHPQQQGHYAPQPQQPYYNNGAPPPQGGAYYPPPQQGQPSYGQPQQY